MLSDDLTIIGVKYDKDNKYDCKIIIKKKINDKTNSIMTYNGNTNRVNTLLVNQNKDYFMAGDYDNVVKYNLTNGKVIKKFNNIGVRQVFSSIRLNNLCFFGGNNYTCLLYTSPSPRDGLLSRMPSSA